MSAICPFIVSGLVAANVSAAAPFQESGGQVIIEAEHYDAMIARKSKAWTLEASSSGYSGEGYMTALPNAGSSVNSNYATGSPELQYPVSFTLTGTYYVWIRGTAPSDNDDSLHAGLDGAPLASSDRISAAAFLAGFAWARDTMDNLPAQILVSTPGAHVVNIWMREDGFKIDKILLTMNPSSTAPAGFGPAESARAAPPNATDSTAPSAPGQPTEDSPTTDADFDADGAYTVFWPPATDPETGISAYELQERGGPAAAWTTLSTTLTTTSMAVSQRADKTLYSYQVRARNGAGLRGPWSTASDGILVDKSPPTGSVSINNDAMYTSTTLVSLILTATDNSGAVARMQRSNTSAFTSTEPYATPAAWTLSPGDGLKTVSVKFSDGAGNWSAVATDSITLDTLAPSVSITSPADGAFFGLASP